MLKQTRVSRVQNHADREAALAVLRSTYQDEKRWVAHAESQFPDTDIGTHALSWFLAHRGKTPAGVLRVCYDPPIAQYRDYKIRLLQPEIDVDRFLANNRIAKIGRFAIIPTYRRSLLLAVLLMRAATRETIERGFTHYITDVFENDPHSPYGFHTRVMGFNPVATHDDGELSCNSRRIALILDLKAAYQPLCQGRSWIFRTLTAGWDERLHMRLTA